MSADLDYDAVAAVKASTYRESTLNVLADGPATPSEIADNTSHEITHISRALREMQDSGVTELLVSEDRRKGRIYGLTDEGEAVAEFINERGEL